MPLRYTAPWNAVYELNALWIQIGGFLTAFNWNSLCQLLLTDARIFYSTFYLIVQILRRREKNWREFIVFSAMLLQNLRIINKWMHKSKQSMGIWNAFVSIICVIENDICYSFVKVYFCIIEWHSHWKFNEQSPWYRLYKYKL